MSEHASESVGPVRTLSSGHCHRIRIGAGAAVRPIPGTVRPGGVTA